MDPEQLTILVAFGAGLLSFASPCVLPVVPLYFAQLLGTSLRGTDIQSGGAVALVQVRQNTFAHAVFFVLGFSIVFIVLGVSVGLVGFLLRSYMPLLSKIAGIVLIIMGLHVAGILEIPFLLQERHLLHPVVGKAGYVRSFAVGAAFSVGWVPCVGPILGGILGLAATSATVAQGAYLLVAYSLGLAVPFLVVGLTMDKTTVWLKKLYPYFRAITLVSGVLLVVMGVLIFTNRLVMLNSYFDIFGLSAGI